MAFLKGPLFAVSGLFPPLRRQRSRERGRKGREAKGKEGKRSQRKAKEESRKRS